MLDYDNKKWKEQIFRIQFTTALRDENETNIPKSSTINSNLFGSINNNCWYKFKLRLIDNDLKTFDPFSKHDTINNFITKRVKKEMKLIILFQMKHHTINDNSYLKFY